MTGNVAAKHADVSDALARAGCKPKQTSGGVCAKCPCCETAASLALRAGAEGSSVTCSKGCAIDAITAHLVKEGGLELERERTPHMGRARIGMTARIATATKPISAAWGTPRPLSAQTGPDFPADALPSWIGPLAHSVAASYEVPLAIPATFALGALATAAAKTACIEMRTDWREPLNLYLGLIAPPGQRKSQVLREFAAPIEEFEAELIKRDEPRRTAVLVARRRIEKQITVATKGDDWSEVGRLEADMPPEPFEPQLITVDASAQKLLSLLAQNGRMSILSAEPNIFATMGGRWAGGVPELDVFLAGHPGDNIRVDRLGRPSDRAVSPALTVCVALQPAALRSLAAAPGTLERGLMARFLWALPQDVRGQAHWEVPSVPDDQRAEYRNGLRAILERPVSEGDVAPPVIRLSKEASKAFCAHFEGVELRMRPGGDLRDLFGWAEKSCGLVGRIAGLYHLADNPAEQPLSASTMAQAIAVGVWATESAKVAFQTMEASPDLRAARAILEAVKRTGRRSRRDVHQALRDRSGFAKAESLSGGFDLLVDHGWLRFTNERQFEAHPCLTGPEGVEGLRVEGGAS